MFKGAIDPLTTILLKQHLFWEEKFYYQDIYELMFIQWLIVERYTEKENEI